MGLQGPAKDAHYEMSGSTGVQTMSLCYWESTLGRVAFSGLFFWLVGLEAPPMRCLKHQKYGQVLIENMERSPIE